MIPEWLNVRRKERLAVRSDVGAVADVTLAELHADVRRAEEEYWNARARYYAKRAMVSAKLAEVRDLLEAGG